MPTAADLLRMADETAQQIEEMRRLLPVLEAQEAELRKAAERLLNIGSGERIIRPMDVNTHGMDKDVKRGAARATRKHPAQKRLYKKGVTITRLADELKEGRPRVSAWFADGVGNRPIPRRHAEHLREKYGIPLSDWGRIAD